MSRSGYEESDGSGDNWANICWRGAVASALRGQRGQAFLRELLAALDALPVKELVEGELEYNGQVCALGAVGKARGIDMSQIDVYDSRLVAHTFGIADAMAREIEWMNDHSLYEITPAKRFARVRDWVAGNIK